MEKQNIALRTELDRPALDRAAVQKAAARLNIARGRLFERELMMLVDMRGVLSDTQWSRMRAQLDRIEANRPMQQQPETDADENKDRQLCRRASRQVAVADKAKTLGKARVVLHALRQPFRQAAKERQRAERDDQCWNS